VLSCRLLELARSELIKKGSQQMKQNENRYCRGGGDVPSCMAELARILKIISAKK
jgi:hypothetical protein